VSPGKPEGLEDENACLPKSFPAYESSHEPGMVRRIAAKPTLAFAAAFLPQRFICYSQRMKRCGKNAVVRVALTSVTMQSEQLLAK